uniref:Uncharacterized protein n=1 Tax=Romanomermis culicivorax TaxID=13658 RepID=A0A915K7Q1_ROMCU
HDRRGWNISGQIWRLIRDFDLPQYLLGAENWDDAAATFGLIAARVFSAYDSLSLLSFTWADS